MPPELHLGPDRLRTHAVLAAGLSEDLRAVGPAPFPVGPGAERLHAAVRHAVGELAALSAALAAAAAAAQEADEEVARSLGRLRP